MNKQRALLIALLVATLGACSKPTTGKRVGGSTPPPSQPSACLDPISGERYRICGRLSTAALQPPDGNKWVAGTVNASSEDVSGGKYRLNGGTFHADR